MEAFVALSSLSPELALPSGVRRIDPTRVESAAFVEALRELDAAAFGGRGVAAPPWVLYDCGLAPGAVVGLLQEGHPVSMLIALPTSAPGIRLVHTLGAAGTIGRDRAELLAETWALGRRLLSLERTLFIEPWQGDVLPMLLVTTGPLRLEVAWAPSHDTPTTATVLAAEASCLEGRRLCLQDLEELRALQAELDGGANCWLVALASAPEAELGVSLEVLVACPDGEGR